MSLLLIQTQYTDDILPQLLGTYSVHCQWLLQQIISHSVENRPSASQAVQLCCIVLYGPTIPLVGDEQYGNELFLFVLIVFM